MLCLPMQTSRKSGVRASVLRHESRERSQLCGGTAGVCPLQTNSICVYCVHIQQPEKAHVSWRC